MKMNGSSGPFTEHMEPEGWSTALNAEPPTWGGSSESTSQPPYTHRIKILTDTNYL